MIPVPSTETYCPLISPAPVPKRPVSPDNASVTSLVATGKGRPRARIGCCMLLWQWIVRLAKATLPVWGCQDGTCGGVSRLPGEIHYIRQNGWEVRSRLPVKMMENRRRYGPCPTVRPVQGSNGRLNVSFGLRRYCIRGLQKMRSLMGMATAPVLPTASATPVETTGSDVQLGRCGIELRCSNRPGKSFDGGQCPDLRAYAHRRSFLAVRQ